ncbi:MAG TPA: hypothetical protein VKR22_10265 [Acidimicrobiales bacterium]|nr:hypothetical protein [Acidimicrobiales bacterium]
MSTIFTEPPSSGRPRIALLTPSWGGAGEERWALRQVAGALALSWEIDVLTPQGSEPQRFRDGAVTVCEAGTAAPWQLAARRDLLLSMLRDRPALSAAERHQLEAVLHEGQEQWDALGGPLAEVEPDLIVMADHREVGAARLIERVCPDVPVLLVPLAGRRAQPEDPYFSPVLELAGAAAVFSQAEMELLGRARPGLPVHHVGLPLASDPSVRREPHDVVGDAPCALVMTGAPFGTANWPATLSKLLQLGFPGQAVVVDAADRLVVFRQGQERHAPAIRRGTDRRRLMAWAKTTVDLHPGGLYSRWALEALLSGSPIVVPAQSRAREHAEAGRGGLWFEGAGDLFWCVEALLDESTHAILAAQGQQYVQERYSGTSAFVERVEGSVRPLVAASSGGRT